MIDTPDAREYIVITPEWANTARWFASALAGHSFDRGARSPIGSFMEQIRYLHQTDPDELQRIIDEFSDKR